MFVSYQRAERRMQARIEIDNVERITVWTRAVLKNFREDSLDFKIADVAVSSDVKLLDRPCWGEDVGNS